jgi:LysM repeat protein
MLLGSVLALWLLVRPPGLPGDSAGIVIPQASPQPATPLAVSPTPTTPVASATAEPTPTPAPTAVPTPTAAPTEEPPAPIEYTVVDGDTWYGIAGAYGVDAESLAAYNGLTLDYLLQPGEVLTIPQ